MSDERIYVRPAPGLKVRDEYTLQHIPAEGAEVLLTRFVQRRINCGDLIKCSPPSLSKPKKHSTSESEG